MEEVHLLSLLEKRTCVRLEMTDERAESGADLMRIITDTMYFGNYKFDMELDTGSETGADQLTIWVAEKLHIDTVPLKQFGVAQLLDALIEPERTRLRDRFEQEKCAF